MGRVARAYMILGPMLAITAAAYSYGTACMVGRALEAQQVMMEAPHVEAVTPVTPVTPVRPVLSLPVPDAPSPEFALPWPPSILASVRPATHDPRALLQRARRLVESDQNVSLQEITIPHAVVALERAELSSFTSSFVPVAHDGWPSGVELARIPPRSLIAYMGLRQGDVVTSVNAYSPTDPRWFDDVTTTAGARAVVELVRDRHRFLYYVSWTE